MKKIIIFIVGIFLINLGLFGQELKTNIGFYARSYGDSIILRWNPGNSSIWEHAKKSGYRISKCEYNGQSENQFDKLPFVVLAKSPFKRLEKETIEILFEKEGKKMNNKELELVLLAYGLSDPLSSQNNDQAYSKDIFEQHLNSLREEKSKVENRFLMAMLPCELSKMAAEITGFRTNDTKVIPGQRYIYKIELEEKHSVYNVEPTYLIITASPFNPDIYRSIIKVDEGHEQLTFTWADIPYVSSYNVYQSIDSINFIKINETPIGNSSTPNYEGPDLTLYNVDSLVIGQKYYYKFYANTPFADELLFGTASGIPKDKTPPLQPFIDSLVHNGKEKVMIHWNKEIYKNETLKGFYIGRADSDTSVFYRIHEGLIPANRNSFQDVYFSTSSSNYYVLCAVDADGNENCSNSNLLVVKDEYPPQPPIPIKGVMDSLGIVTLTLKPQSEKDFMGYRVYKANADYHEFSVVNETWSDSLILNPKDTILIDTSTLESLTKFIYYKITALDYHYNESFFSTVIKVPRPDKYPPVPPLINDYNVFNDKIIFGITVSSSEDAVQNYILRKKENEVSWKIIDSVGIRDTIYTDYSPENSGAYHYAVQAKDDSGLISKMGNVVRLQTYYKPRPLDLDISCTYFPKNNMVLATWVYKEKVDNDLAVAIYNPVDKPNDYKGIIRNSIQTTYAFNSQSLPMTIKIKAQTSKREYLPTISNTCIIDQNDINENEEYKNYKRIK
jgi:uncharacterized protein